MNFIRQHRHHGHLSPAGGSDCYSVFPRRDRDIRCFAFAISLLTFWLPCIYPGTFTRDQDGFQYEQSPVDPDPNIHYHLGMDGISMWLVVLTTFLTPLCVLISWTSIHERVKEFFILMLVLETALIGVFLALDLFLFYFFWEATLIRWRCSSAFTDTGGGLCRGKFFLYTMIASVFMLAGVLWLYAKTGSFDFVGDSEALSAARSGICGRRPMALPGLLRGFRGEGSAVSVSTPGCRTRTSRLRPQVQSY